MRKVPLIKTAWKRALLEIYFHAPKSWTEDSNCNRNTGNSPLQKKLGILNNQQFAECIIFLEEQKLIETKREKKYQYWALTEKGFNVALELQKQIREIKEEKMGEDIKLSTVLLTFILALTGMTNLAKEIYPNHSNAYFWLYCGCIVFFIMGLFLVRIRKR